jgi:rare lipoprotein A
MQKRLLFLLWTLLASVLTLQAQLPQKGYASYYGDKFHGHKTASGERYHKDSFTAAHRTLSFGTLVKVTNVKKGLSVVVRINDRGPYIRSRKIDLSKAAARKIGLVGVGVGYVKIEKYEDSELPVIFADGTRKGPSAAEEESNISYVVQTGIFRKYSNASGLKDTLHSVGYVGFTIDTIRVNEETMFRVATLPFTRKDEAEELAKKLRHQEFDSYVIRL